jgi:hypothetical protein
VSCPSVSVPVPSPSSGVLGVSPPVPVVGAVVLGEEVVGDEVVGDGVVGGSVSSVGLKEGTAVEGR